MTDQNKPAATSNKPARTQNVTKHKHKATVGQPIGGAAPRISKRVREAIILVAHKGATQSDAEKETGLSQGYFTKVMHKPHIKQAFQEQQALAQMDIANIKASGKKMAMVAAIDLLQKSQSDTVKARMVEFLASETKDVASPVTIINAPGGYQYARPSDPASGAIDGEAEEIE